MLKKNRLFWVLSINNWTLVITVLIIIADTKNSCNLISWEEYNIEHIVLCGLNIAIYGEERSSKYRFQARNPVFLSSLKSENWFYWSLKSLLTMIVYISAGNL